MAKMSKAEVRRSKAMASLSLVPVDSTHMQHKQELVTTDGGAVTVAFVVVASHVLILAPHPLGSKLAVSKK